VATSAIERGAGPGVLTMAGVGDYDPGLTDLCERMLVTVIGNAGFWGRRLYLVGGLVPRYLYGPTVPGVAHVGSRDVHLAVVLMVDDPTSKSYETLTKNLLDGGFVQAPFDTDPDFRWRKEVDGASLILEFICETDKVPPGRNFKPRSGSGSRFQAFNVRGARLASLDCKPVQITAERLDEGGISKVGVQVAGLLPFMVLKILAFGDRHRDKDAYDIVWTLSNHPDGAEGAGREMASSPVVSDPLCSEALQLLRDRFAGPANDAPTAYSTFMGVGSSRESAARLRLEAVETVRLAMDAFDRAYGSAR
jgi:hypothetical protein